MNETDNRTSGARLVADLRAYFESYMQFPNPADSLIVALWCVGTWATSYFYTFPYLVVTKGQPGCGASVLLELIGRVCLNGWLTTAATPANILHNLYTHGGAMTLLFDEAEVTNTESKSFMSQVLNSGYRKGQTIARMRGKEQIFYPSYCGKAFTMIGSTASTIVDRSLVLVLQKAQPPRPYMPWTADAESAALVAQLKRVLEGELSAPMAMQLPAHLQTRDQEIWSAMFGLATALGLSKADVFTLTAWSSYNCAWKAGNGLRELGKNIADPDDAYAVRALADLRRVFKADETAIYSTTALDRMLALPDAPWLGYMSHGLDALTLGKLLAKAGLVRSADKVKIKGRPLSGYKLADVDAALRQDKAQISDRRAAILKARRRRQGNG